MLAYFLQKILIDWNEKASNLEKFNSRVYKSSFNQTKILRKTKVHIGEFEMKYNIWIEVI